MAGRPRNKVKSHRVQITLKDPVYKKLLMIAEKLDRPPATVVSESFEQFIPTFEFLFDSVENFKSENKEKLLHMVDDAIDLLGESLESLSRERLEMNKESGIIKHKASFDISDKGINDD